MVNDNLQVQFAPPPTEHPGGGGPGSGAGAGAGTGSSAAAAGRVFAMGDCMVHPGSGEAKLGHTAEVNAHLVVENVRRASTGKP